MEAERWKQVDELLQSALLLPSEQRDEFLRHACAGDAGLEQEVRSLLASDQSAGGFLEGPAIKDAAQAIALIEVRQAGDAVLGQTISHYRVLRKLGSGGMGAVYEAEDLRLGRHVALKLLLESQATSGKARQRFEHEARAIASLNHPHICTLYEVEEYDGKLAIVMELLQGETLKQRMKGGSVALAQVLQWGTEVADALEAAHAAGLIHRDIKPANIFITHRGSAKVLDFGLAKLSLAPSDAASPIFESLTSLGVIPGTTPYMSPEQVLGKELDARTDLFSLGVVLYEMATGVLPFSGETSGAVFDAILHRAPTPPVQINPKLPPELERIVNKALEKDRDLRYQSAIDVRTDLQRLRRDSDSGRVVGAPGTSQPHRIVRLRGAWALSAALLAVFGAITLFVYRYRSHAVLPPNGRAPLYVAEFTNATGDTVFDDVLQEIVKNELSRSPAVEVVDDNRVSELLRTMGKSLDARLTPELTQQLCERGHGKLMAQSEIKPQGAGYVIELSVLDCASRRTLSHEQAESKDKDRVMTTVSRLSAATRLRLSGNSANQPAPNPAALPTASLPAFKAYVMGANLLHSQPRQSAAMLRRATELDPNLAEAWRWLYFADRSLGETQRANQDLKRAFALREKLADTGKAAVEGGYYLDVTGEVYKGIDALRALESLDPNQFPPHNLLGVSYSDLGLYQKATDELRLAVALFPSAEIGNSNLSRVLLAQGRYDEAETALRHIAEGKAEGPHLHSVRYWLALLRSDRGGLEQERTWMAQNADDLSVVSTQARIDLLDGRVHLARQRAEHAVSIALESDLKESAANALLFLAEAQALFGESIAARKSLSEVAKFENSKSVKVDVARVMALNGQGREAQHIMDSLVREHPSDTFLNGVDAPLVLAASQLSSG